MNYAVSIIGVGFVGSAMKQSFQEKGVDVKSYDKYKASDTFLECLDNPILFLALPTPFCESKNRYDKSALEQTLQSLSKLEYDGTVVIKSTIEPGTTTSYSEAYPHLHLVHNPEFLTARTAYEDFHQQRHIVLGSSPKCPPHHISKLKDFYHQFYPKAEISVVSSLESESMKSFVNSFYSVKVQFFNELYLLCQKNGCNYEKVKSLMIKNGWINPMHTDVPGPDGLLSYGGACFPKDTNALLQEMKHHGSPCQVLNACIEERNKMRDDHTNIIEDCDESLVPT